MALLPYFQSNNKDLNMLQTKWASILNPVISNPLNGVTILKNIPVSYGTNVINHMLGQVQQGWFVLDQDNWVLLYRNAPFNDKTLSLMADASATISLGVF